MPYRMSPLDWLVELRKQLTELLNVGMIQPERVSISELEQIIEEEYLVF